MHLAKGALELRFTHHAADLRLPCPCFFLFHANSLIPFFLSVGLTWTSDPAPHRCGCLGPQPSPGLLSRPSWSTPYPIPCPQGRSSF